jgi:putative hydrolase of HD superfamily
LVYYYFMTDILTLTDEELLVEAKKLLVGYKQKSVIRYAGAREEGVHAESDAEHVFGLIYLAQYFLQHESTGPALDAYKVMQILLFHDFPEIKYGDVVTFDKTESDQKREFGAAAEVFNSLPEALATLGKERWSEYEEQKTPEGRFCFALDKIEPLFELMDPVAEKSMKRLKVTYEMHVAHKFFAAKEYPVLMRFVEVMSKDMLARDIFYKA